MKNKIKPLGNRVVVEPTKDEGEKTVAGIIIPSSAQKEKPETGTVIALGENVKHVKEGDTVLFSKYGYDEITIDDTDYLIVKEDSIMAVLK